MDRTGRGAPTRGLTVFNEPTMRSLIRASFGVAALTALVACSDNTTATVTAPTPPSGPNLFLAAPACDFTALKANARAYAASNKDDLFTIIGDLQAMYRRGNAQTTDKAFDGLARLAAMRRTTAQLGTATGDTFNALTLGFIGCMQTSISEKLPDDFSVAGALGTGWIYEVRGKGGVDADGGAYARGSTGAYWAAEASLSWTPASDQKRFLIYGYPILFPVNDTKVGSALELRTVPAIGAGLTLSSPLNIGLCNVTVGSAVRVQHVSDVLPKKGLVCTPGEVAPLQVGLSGLVHRAIEWLSPKPAYAAMFVGSIGGAVSELSPSVVIDMGNVNFKFVNGIADGRNSRAMTDSSGNPVSVSAKTAGLKSLPAGIVVTLSIAGNQSNIAFFKVGKNGASVATVTRTTNGQGIAVFDDVFITKAGGYQLVATGTWDELPGTPVISNSFNIQNK